MLFTPSKILFTVLSILGVYIIETGGASFEKPWYGQLMTGPQLIAYLVQVDPWMREYKVKLAL